MLNKYKVKINGKAVKKRKKSNESKMQSSCIKWFRYQYGKDVLFAIPNGGKRGIVEAKIMKGEGVLAGVADLFLMKGCGEYFGYFLEAKTEKGRQSKEQKAFEEKCKQNNYKYSLFRSLDEFIDIVSKYMAQCK